MYTTLKKVDGVVYRPHHVKLYLITKNGKEVGSIEQSVCLTYWYVLDDMCCIKTRHRSIKAAARSAKEIF